MKWVLNAPTIQASRARAAVAAGLTETLATAAFLGSVAEFPHLRNQAPDLYRAFIEQCWQHASDRGLTSLIHPRSHFTEAKAAPLRREAYLRLRRNWNITNKLGLFDINRDEKNFDVAIYGSRRAEPDFIMASSVHHPRVINESLIHDGSGTLPAFRDDNDKWDLRPHRERILHVDLERLSAWKSILEDENTSVLDTRMVYTVNSNAMQILTLTCHRTPDEGSTATVLCRVERVH
ncbi:hypothetical protein [Corynebacterium neomassiliense]|uniref:hypothetical protein n=1 Tax=Corynebacterium neomassiliense TaxID=2079482 RepID=UPI00102FB6BB|nr:hypothetical protein [Corynebacterium neomassiliense]